MRPARVTQSHKCLRIVVCHFYWFFCLGNVRCSCLKGKCSRQPLTNSFLYFSFSTKPYSLCYVCKFDLCYYMYQAVSFFYNILKATPSALLLIYKFTCSKRIAKSKLKKLFEMSRSFKCCFLLLCEMGTKLDVMNTKIWAIRIYLKPFVIF